LGFFLLVSAAGLGLFLAGLLLVVFRGAVAHGIGGFGGWLYRRDESFPAGCLNLRSPRLRVTQHSARALNSNEQGRAGSFRPRRIPIYGCYELLSLGFFKFRSPEHSGDDDIACRTECVGPKQPIIPRRE
jgi:hypothetical protein